ncbi:MAG: 1-phosphofructokinase family hexose kinase [Caulobacteraceae bacterium]
MISINGLCPAGEYRCRMPEIITFTPSPAIDVSTSTPRLEPNHKLRCRALRRDPGGGGINVARVARRLGADVEAIYPSGGHTGALLDRLLAEEGVATRPIPAGQDTRENFYGFEEEIGQQFKFILPGPELSEQVQADCLTAVMHGPAHPGFVVFSGGLPAGAPRDFYARAARTAKDSGAKVVIDSSGEPLAAALDEGVHLFKPSLRELEGLLQQSLPDEADWLNACVELVATGKAETVALSLGEQGALLVNREHAWRGYPPKLVALSSIGAGDSFLAAMLVSLVAGASAPEALRQAIAAGGAALLAPGTELARLADIGRLHDEVLIHPLSRPTITRARAKQTTSADSAVTV